MAEEQQKREDENNEIKEMGTLNMKESGSKYGIQLLTIIGEIEGHDSVSGNTKATKYEHLLPRLAQIEEDDETDGVLILLNTLGGDVDIASIARATFCCWNTWVSTWLTAGVTSAKVARSIKRSG